jgi:hypothetical protein
MRLGNKDHNDGDYFSGIIKSIADGYADEIKNINYGSYVKLCKETIIIIDESQDLSPDYILAIAKIMGTTHVDTYIIGDKLQSIWDENNVFTHLEKNDFPYPIKIHRFNGKNEVRRFHNKQFIGFVNNIIDFEKYNLPKISGICDGSNCEYNHNDNEKPYDIFEMPNIYLNDQKSENIEKTIITVILYMEKEIENNNYLPNNFMFIFPYLNKNGLANALESKLQEFWKNKFQDINYNNNVVKKHEYWNNEYTDNKYIQYVYFHKSSEGKSINLAESKNSTRLLSIHASKGLGCEVVFLLGINEQMLHFYSNKTDSLQYDSLLHVAITRQKLKLYVGIMGINCDVYKKIKKAVGNIIIDNNIEPK